MLWHVITTNFSVQKAYLTDKCNGTEEKEDSAVCPKEVLPDQKISALWPKIYGKLLNHISEGGFEIHKQKLHSLLVT